MIFYFDVETSGLDPRRHCILQIAWIIEKNGEVISEKSYDVTPSDMDDLNLGALRVNGFTLERMQAGKSLSYVMAAVVGDLRAHKQGSGMFRPCGHNVPFDISFLVPAMNLTHEAYLNHLSLHGALDTCAIARFYGFLGLLQLDNYRLETCCKDFEILLKAHDALADIRATRELFHKLITLYEMNKNVIKVFAKNEP